MAGNKISMLAIVSSTPKQFWRYATRFAVPNSGGPHSTLCFIEKQRVFFGEHPFWRLVLGSVRTVGRGRKLQDVMNKIGT